MGAEPEADLDDEMAGAHEYQDDAWGPRRASWALLVVPRAGRACGAGIKHSGEGPVGLRGSRCRGRPIKAGRLPIGRAW